MKKLTLIILFFSFLRGINAQDCQLSYANEVKKMVVNDSVIIAYKETGKGKQTLLMIHGLGGNLSHWTNNFIANIHCIAIDLPSYGLSSMQTYTPKTSLLDFYAETILAFIKKKKLKKVTLMGHSMGGQIAIITALKNAKSIKKLILAAPAGFETFDQADSKSLLGFSKPETFKNQKEAVLRVAFKRNFYQMPSSAETLIKDRLMLAECPSYLPYFQAVASGVRGMLEYPVQKSLGNIKIPTLVIFGANDDLIPNKILHKNLTTKQVFEIGKAIPKVNLIEIPQAGHLVMYEQSTLFNKHVSSFLNE